MTNVEFFNEIWYLASTRARIPASGGLMILIASFPMTEEIARDAAFILLAHMKLAMANAQNPELPSLIQQVSERFEQTLTA